MIIIIFSSFLYVNISFFRKGNPYRREVHYHGLQQQNSKWPDKHYMQVIESVRKNKISDLFFFVSVTSISN
jgi:hypothetical protein